MKGEEDGEGRPRETSTDTDTGDTGQHKQGRNTKFAEPDVIKPGQTSNGDVLYPLCSFLTVTAWYLPLFCPLPPIPVCVLPGFCAVSSGWPLELTCFRKSSYVENQYNWRAHRRANVKEQKSSQEPQRKTTKWCREEEGTQGRGQSQGDRGERVKVTRRGDKRVQRPPEP